MTIAGISLHSCLPESYFRHQTYSNEKQWHLSKKIYWIGINWSVYFYFCRIIPSSRTVSHFEINKLLKVEYLQPKIMNLKSKWRKWLFMVNIKRVEKVNNFMIHPKQPMQEYRCSVQVCNLFLWSQRKSSRKCQWLETNRIFHLINLPFHKLNCIVSVSV